MSRTCDPLLPSAGWRHGDRLSLASRPYSVVGEAGRLRPGRLKRYIHAAPHAPDGAPAPRAVDLMTEICRASGRSASRIAPSLALWRDIESAAMPGFDAGAIQIREAAAGDPLEAKAYFRPDRGVGLGLRPAAMVLERAVEARRSGHGRDVRRELLRREAIDEIFYVAAAMRPDLEIETYHDCEERRPDFLVGEIRAIAARMAGSEAMAERAAGIVALAAGTGFASDHFSCDLRPDSAGGISVVLSPPRPLSRDRSGHLALVAALSRLSGSVTPPISRPSQITIDAAFAPAVVAVKILPGERPEDPARHAVFIEDIEPEFPARL